MFALRFKAADRCWLPAFIRRTSTAGDFKVIREAAVEIPERRTAARPGRERPLAASQLLQLTDFFRREASFGFCRAWNDLAAGLARFRIRPD